MKIDIKSFTKPLQPLTKILKKDAVGIFLLIVAAVFGFLIWRIGNLAGAEPTQDAINEQLVTVVRPKIDPKGIKLIEELQDQNIDIQSYFSNRDNPFQE